MTEEDYVELHAKSAFSFLAGASLPEDLVRACAGRGVAALAVLDRDNLSGAVRLHKEAASAGVRAHVGAEITLADGTALPLLAETREGYRNLCRLITRIKLRAEKGKAAAAAADLAEFSGGLVCLTGGEDGPLAAALAAGRGRELLGELVSLFGGGNVYVELQRHFDRAEEARNQAALSLAQGLGLPPVATNGVRHALPEDRELLDVLTCVKHKVDVRTAGRLLARNAERHVKGGGGMRQLFADLPGALAGARDLSARLGFTLADLGYEFPRYPVVAGETEESLLRRLAEGGARRRYGRYGGRAWEQVERELAVITRLKLAGYFLVVWDIVQYCERQGVLVQGRGSAANSAVCYALGITAVDPVGMGLLFERFLSEERGEWPDIDLDLPSGEARERVIQYVYGRYGHHGAAMTANVITYREKSAVRDVGKALSVPGPTLDRLSALMLHFEWDAPEEEALRRFAEAGLSLGDPPTAKFYELFRKIRHLPRHLGQHSGGMVICRGALDAVVPLEPATMPGRTVVQWDKEDCADMGIVKVDLLGLGMMAVLADTVRLVSEHYGEEVDLARLPADDPTVYGVLRRADTVGWFQVESRAQMSCLPRTGPRKFYDLVVQVAIVRPGPIVGEMASPYIRRRQGKEKPEPLHPWLEPVLARTLGVPLFQEQLMRMAMVIAGFTGGEAEQLRRACGAKRSREAMGAVEEKLRRGMTAKGVDGGAQDRVVKAITSFAMYGFPESHAASFALLAYASGYLKCRYLAAYCAAMLNNQPMGFYGPAVLVKDAQRHGLRFLPVDVQRSGWECVPERAGGSLGVRLGLNYVKGLRRQTAEAVIGERGRGPYLGIQELCRRVPGLRADELRALSAAGALQDIRPGRGTTRRDALWESEDAVRPAGPLLDLIEETPEESPLRQMTEAERVEADLRATGLTIGKHPLRFLRQELGRSGVVAIGSLPSLRHGSRIRVAGLVICRQRPASARGVAFLSLEDETGIVNVVFMPDLFEKYRRVIVGSPALLITGALQRLEGTVTVKAGHAEPLSDVETPVMSYDFH